MDIPPFRRCRRSLALVVAAAVLAVVLLGLIAPRTSAQPPNYVSGNACANGPNPRWQTGETWIMTFNVTVPAGCVLTIEPGTTVLANRAVRLFVVGQLLANGTSSSLITFDTNGTSVPWTWGGVQFNKSASRSYVQYASLHQADVALHAIRSSPTFMHDVISRAFFGVALEDSSATFGWSWVNYTTMGVRINGSVSSPSISTNTIQVVVGGAAVGIYVDNAGSPFILFNTIRWVNATAGANAASIGGRGQDGGFAAGIVVNDTSLAVVNVNTVDQVSGGRGGNGGASLSGNGGTGGTGGSAVGIAVASTATSKIESNAVTNVVGGRGGTGGAVGTAALTGGTGGAGGAAIAYETLSVSASARWYSNSARWITGGSAGDGGNAVLGATVGNGGRGGDAYGLFASQAMAGNASVNTIRNVVGGYSGNGTRGGVPGQAAGIWIYGVDGATLIANNTITSLTGGTASNYVAPGGNATAILAVGDGAPFNLTAILNNAVSSVLGGTASLGGNPGAVGGTAVGIGAVHVQLKSSANVIQTVQGGQGGGTTSGSQNGQGGLGVGFFAALLAGVSSSDRIQTVTGGASGTGGTPAPASEGLGLYSAGNATYTAVLLVANATFSSIGTDDLSLDTYTEMTTLNSTFNANKLAIQAAANLTVQNFLAVTAFWPNNVTAVAGANLQVTDNAAVVYNRAAPSGSARWIPVTNRVYSQGTVATWNVTQVTVSYLPYGFANDPRTVNLTASQTQYFTMVDTTPPSSSASALPTWTGTRTFTIHYSYTDGFGVGVASVTLWNRTGGGAWQAYAVQTVTGSGTGQFSFTAASDGTYEFATTAVDKDGNAQTPAPPTANDTWTIVDTTKPGSHVNALPTYEASLSFAVSWGPDAGTTDVNTYQIQYNAGSGWVTWFGDTRLTSAVFNATSQGLYQFRSIAFDFAGNTEIPPATNDTWTIVDTIPPASTVVALPAYEARAIFNVSWGPQSGTTDVATYRIQMSDDGGAWRDWTTATAAASAAFTGLDGHRYAFRSLSTDRAGNVEPKSANDTWTIVDISPPASAVSALSRYEAALAFTVTWGPTAGTSDVSTYTVYASDNGGSWAAVGGAVNTQATSATFTGSDGHTYAFRSIATDRAGNVETKSAGNDTFTTVDVTKPFVVADAPEGAGTNATPAVTVTFSEPMNALSVQLAFSIAPAINGNFSWSGGGRVLTFVPARPLQPSTTYTVVIDTSATDLAGNSLAGLKTFTFTTAVGAGLGAGSMADLWPILAIVAAVALGALLFFVYRRRIAGEAAAEAKAPPAPPKTPAAIDDVFLLYGRDGVLIKHETRRLRPDVDTDILSGMLTAVQQFVKDSFRGEEGEELNEMTVGQMHILIGRGKWLILAATMSGGDIDLMNEQMGRCIRDMEDHNWDRLEDWDGDMELAKVLSPYMKRLIRGDYAQDSSIRPERYAVA